MTEYVPTMRALVRDREGVGLVQRARPSPAHGEVAIDVAYAGVCRTDLAVAGGAIEVADGRVLGHELAGCVAAVGEGTSLALGTRVTAIPFAPCGDCACVRGERCGQPRWLGLDRDGGFADRVCVPASCVVPLPAALSLAHGAYVEPVAAALGALAAIGASRRVLVSGTGRIAELTARVIATTGASVERHVPGEALRAAAFDVAIEHGGDPAPLLPALRPGGTLVLKSRASGVLALDPRELVARELTVRGASHGSFTAAVDWLHARRIIVDDLLAPARPLEDFADVLAAARASEEYKQMFAIAPEVERD